MVVHTLDHASAKGPLAERALVLVETIRKHSQSLRRYILQQRSTFLMMQESLRQ